jgi:hypothetical protein
LPDGTYLPADASNDDRKAIAKKYREDIKMEILRQSMPLPKLTAHKYYKAGERITIEMKSNAVNWKPTLEEMSDDNDDFFVLVNGKEYKASPYVGPFNGFTCWHTVPKIASEAIGKYRFAYGWKNVDVVNPEEPSKVIHFDRLITDEAEFEVVDSEGWETKWRGKTPVIADLPDGSVLVGSPKEQDGQLTISINDTFYEGTESRVIAIDNNGKRHTGA